MLKCWFELCHEFMSGYVESFFFSLKKILTLWIWQIYFQIDFSDIFQKKKKIWKHKNDENLFLTCLVLYFGFFCNIQNSIWKKLLSSSSSMMKQRIMKNDDNVHCIWIILHIFFFLVIWIMMMMMMLVVIIIIIHSIHSFCASWLMIIANPGTQIYRRFLLLLLFGPLFFIFSMTITN